MVTYLNSPVYLRGKRDNPKQIARKGYSQDFVTPSCSNNLLKVPRNLSLDRKHLNNAKPLCIEYYNSLYIDKVMMKILMQIVKKILM